MSIQSRISRANGTKVKRTLGVQAALEWAFRVEKAQLELPRPQDINEEGFGFGLEFVLLQRAALGCQIDGGQRKIGGYIREDVEVLACPVTFSPHPHQIEAARRAHDDWWQALGWVRDGLIESGMLRDVEVTAAMPSPKPCKRKSALPKSCAIAFWHRIHI